MKRRILRTGVRIFVLDVVALLVKKLEVWALRNGYSQIIGQNVVRAPDCDGFFGILVDRSSASPNSLFKKKLDRLVNMKQCELHVSGGVASKEMPQPVVQNLERGSKQGG